MVFPSISSVAYSSSTHCLVSLLLLNWTLLDILMLLKTQMSSCYTAWCLTLGYFASQDLECTVDIFIISIVRLSHFRVFSRNICVISINWVHNIDLWIIPVSRRQLFKSNTWKVFKFHEYHLQQSNLMMVWNDATINKPNGVEMQLWKLSWYIPFNYRHVMSYYFYMWHHCIKITSFYYENHPKSLATNQPKSTLLGRYLIEQTNFEA